MAKLREFIYIDKESLNSSLSSLGKGITSEVTRATEDQKEKGGNAGANIAGIGGEGNYLSMDREQIETRLDVTAPYRFQDLLDEIEKNGIDIKENPDPRKVSRGDVVKIDGTIHPMSILKIKMALDAFEIFTDKFFNEALRRAGSETMVTSTMREEMDAFSQVISTFSGNVNPIRIETSDSIFCTTLKSSNMRKSVFEAFEENGRYELFGRIKHRVPRNEKWNPLYALNILSRYVPDDDSEDEFIQSLRTAANDLNIELKSEDMRVPGRTAVIEPIAVYW
jgi:hypothetical protein